MEQPVPAWVFLAVFFLFLVVVLSFFCFFVCTVDLQTLAGFLQSLDKAAAYAHYLANRFHLQAKTTVGAFKLIKVPARYFNDHVIQRWLKIGRSSFGDLVFYFIKVITYCKLRSNFSDRVTGSF